MIEYEIGDRMTFVPAIFTEDGYGMKLTTVRPGIDLRVTGTVDYINREHHWVRVAWKTAAGDIQHECFKY